MKSILKKNQIMITALAIMIAVAGYLNFAGKGLEEEEYLSASGENVAMDNPTVDEMVQTDDYDLTALLDISEEDLAEGEVATSQITDIESLDSDAEVILDDYLDLDMETALLSETAEGEDVPGEAVFANTSSVATLSDAKLLKEQTRAKNKEALLEIINSDGLSDTQKQTAVDSMIKMTGIAEKETAAEILLEAKGFEDVVVSISETGVDVVVNALELTDAQRAQIEDIVKRKTDADAANIIISTVVQ